MMFFLSVCVNWCWMCVCGECVWCYVDVCVCVIDGCD